MPSPLALDRLVVEEHPRLLQVGQSFSIGTAEGERVGEVVQINQSPVHVLAKFSNAGEHVPVTFELRDVSGAGLLRVHKPWFRKRGEVSRPDGPVGTIQKQLRLGRARFVLHAHDGREVGQLRSEDWRGRRFAVQDETGESVARVAKRWDGVMRSVFTDADTYGVELRPGLEDPLRSLALVACLVVDVLFNERSD